jgi:hypothetical protein
MTAITCAPVPPWGERSFRAPRCGTTHPENSFCPFKIMDVAGRPDDCCKFMADNLAMALERLAPRLHGRLSKDMTADEARQFAIDLAGVLGRLPAAPNKSVGAVRALGQGVLWFLVVSSLGCEVRALAGEDA